MAGAAPAGAAEGSAQPLKRVGYRGLRLEVPRSWPVIRLDRHPQACVRFDRHVVYLGRPGRDQLCPATPAGRTEAILVQPLRGAERTLALGTAAGSVARVADRGHGVVLTATWARHPALVRRALGVRDLAALARRSHARPVASRTARFHTATRRSRDTSPAPAPSMPGGIYTGSGFDACSTPSTTTMSAWGASPYRAIGVYIGGANMACSQPNLTAAWVSQEGAAGWHLAPIYVGLQAPGNSCGCAAITPSQAPAQGAAAASDAIAQAQAIGLGAGNPVYFDMEGYSHTSANTQAVLAFLQAWTQGLHAAGYLSGVYSSNASGIADLVSQTGTGYSEPDEIWFAYWNNAADTNDPYIPTGDWANHQRLHQYQGGHDETWGGVKINIDSDYLDSATAASGAMAPPAATTAPALTGAPLVGQVLTESHARWTGGPTSYAYQWLDCTPDGATCTPIAGATAQTYTVAASDAAQSVRVQETAAGAGGTGAPAMSGLTAAIATTPNSGYWVTTAYGNVFNSPGAGFYGSPARWMKTGQIAGLAPTRDRRGYWLTSTSGAVLAYGDAPRVRRIVAPGRVAGIVADPSSHGFWLFTTTGNVIAENHARFRGSPAHSRVHLRDFVGMAATLDGRGYWLTTSTGRVYAFGDAKRVFGVRARHPIRGIVAAPGGGVWLYTAYGNVYNLGGSPWLGSAVYTHTTSVRGMDTTADRQGYWLVTASGATLAFGDAATWRLRRPPHPVTGLIGG